MSEPTILQMMQELQAQGWGQGLRVQTDWLSPWDTVYHGIENAWHAMQAYADTAALNPPLVVGRTLTTLEWAQERLANSERIAATKIGPDHAGWVEDTRYWRDIVQTLEAIYSTEVDREDIADVHPEDCLCDACVCGRCGNRKHEGRCPRQEFSRCTGCDTVKGTCDYWKNQGRAACCPDCKHPVAR